MITFFVVLMARCFARVAVCVYNEGHSSRLVLGSPSFYRSLITRYLSGKYIVNHRNYSVITTGNKKVNTEELKLKY